MFIKKFREKNKSFIFFNVVMFIILSYAVAFLLHISYITENEIYSQVLFNRSVLIFEYIICSFTVTFCFSVFLRLIEKGKIK